MACTLYSNATWTIWRCISYLKRRELSIVMLFYRRIMGWTGLWPARSWQRWLQWAPRMVKNNALLLSRANQYLPRRWERVTQVCKKKQTKEATLWLGVLSVDGFFGGFQFEDGPKTWKKAPKTHHVNGKSHPSAKAKRKAGDGLSRVRWLPLFAVTCGYAARPTHLGDDQEVYCHWQVEDIFSIVGVDGHGGNMWE